MFTILKSSKQLRSVKLVNDNIIGGAFIIKSGSNNLYTDVVVILCEVLYSKHY